MAAHIPLPKDIKSNPTRNIAISAKVLLYKIEQYANFAKINNEFAFDVYDKIRKDKEPFVSNNNAFNYYTRATPNHIEKLRIIDTRIHASTITAQQMCQEFIELHQAEEESDDIWISAYDECARQYMRKSGKCIHLMIIISNQIKNSVYSLMKEKQILSQKYEPYVDTIERKNLIDHLENHQTLVMYRSKGAKLAKELSDCFAACDSVDDIFANFVATSDINMLRIIETDIKRAAHKILNATNA